MRIIHGSDQDISNIVSDKPLQINSCGINTTLQGGHAIDNDILIRRPSGRKDYQLLYMTSGQADYMLDGVWQTLHEGQVVIYHPDVPQYYLFQANVPMLCRWIHFSGTQVESLLREAGLWDRVFYDVQSCAEADHLLADIMEQIQQKAVLYRPMTNAMLQQVIALLGRQLLIHRNETRYLSRERVMQVASYLQCHYDEPQTLDDLAERCGLSRYHFIHAFKESMGVSPYAYLIGIRMERAKELLRTSSLSVTDAARVCGYDNPLYFCRVFSERVGMPPSQYQAKAKQKLAEEEQHPLPLPADD